MYAYTTCSLTAYSSFTHNLSSCAVIIGRIVKGQDVRMTQLIIKIDDLSMCFYFIHTDAHTHAQVSMKCLSSRSYHHNIAFVPQTHIIIIIMLINDSNLIWTVVLTTAQPSLSLFYFWYFICRIVWWCHWVIYRKQWQ